MSSCIFFVKSSSPPYNWVRKFPGKEKIHQNHLSILAPEMYQHMRMRKYIWPRKNSYIIFGLDVHKLRMNRQFGGSLDLHTFLKHWSIPFSPDIIHESKYYHNLKFGIAQKLKLSSAGCSLAIDFSSLHTITLVASVWLFSTVPFQMCPQSTFIRGCKITLVAFVSLLIIIWRR